MRTAPPVIKVKSRYLVRACMAEMENSDRVTDLLRLLSGRVFDIDNDHVGIVPLSVVITHSDYEEEIDRWLSSLDGLSDWMRRLSRLSYSYHPSDKAAIEWATTHVCEYHSAILITKELDLPF